MSETTKATDHPPGLRRCRLPAWVKALRVEQIALESKLAMRRVSTGNRNRICGISATNRIVATAPAVSAHPFSASPSYRTTGSAATLATGPSAMRLPSPASGGQVSRILTILPTRTMNALAVGCAAISLRPANTSNAT